MEQKYVLSREENQFAVTYYNKILPIQAEKNAFPYSISMLKKIKCFKGRVRYFNYYYHFKLTVKPENQYYL